MAFIEMDFASGGGGGISGFFEDPLTITADSGMVGKPYSITLENSDGSSDIEIASGTLKATQDYKISSLGKYNVYVNSLKKKNFVVDDFNITLPQVAIYSLEPYYLCQNGALNSTYLTDIPCNTNNTSASLNFGYATNSISGYYSMARATNIVSYSGQSGYAQYETPIIAQANQIRVTAKAYIINYGGTPKSYLTKYNVRTLDGTTRAIIDDVEVLRADAESDKTFTVQAQNNCIIQFEFTTTLVDYACGICLKEMYVS